MKRRSKITSVVDPDEATADPKAHFEKPADVVEHEALDAEDKQRILEAWDREERALQVATEEGMAGGEPPRLAEVREALGQVADAPKAKPDPSKYGGEVT
jgi:hypothetical protein